ncbi:uncharacterized protein BO96DRAFT_386725 [Aspergillus niger CBS 101883]|uniref:uncharacterized protein n=1 Tax=Aspergillus lacticoffeatus (strain CBS 101883) TaxID=1450533 RepID=UPI000D7F27AC|nr:uncharacterized protein BO96DRAFT_386725 [Aspergillus niger CBS 101883]PYH60281.1 hypothetical protein BO96DRAFT_386725 [Aspergillus niger CBS 101883]
MKRKYPDDQPEIRSQMPQRKPRRSSIVLQQHTCNQGGNILQNSAFSGSSLGTLADSLKHAAYPPEDELCPGGEPEIPADEMNRGIQQGGNTKYYFLIALQVRKSIVAKTRQWPFEGCDRHLHEKLYIQGPTWE